MENIIKDVAIYLRKSRDEESEEDVLSKHRELLIEYANKNNLNYKIYEEIGTSQSIDLRPEMVKLLKDVEQDLYDAVLVVDLDRLTRGDFEEIGRLRRILKNSNTLVLTPTKIYDFNNEEQEVMTDIEQVFAKFEYNQIKKRMLRGKKQGAKAGKWVNGAPPFPYVYNKITKELEVDKDKLKVYNLMKKMFIEDMQSGHEISWELNRLGIKTNRGASWHENSVKRVLTSEIHLGKVIHGKTFGKNHTPVKDKSEWIIAEGSHQRLKTEAEHQQILAILESRRFVPKGTRTNIQVLSKLIYCGKCGASMSFLSRPSGKCYIKTCLNADPYGVKCRNSSMKVEVVYAQIFFDLEQYEEQLLNHDSQKIKFDNSTLQLVLDNKKDELVKLEKGIERLLDLFVEGLINKEKLKLKQNELQQKMQLIKEEIRSIEKSLAIVNNSRTDEARLKCIKRFKKAWNTEGISKKELNTLAKQIIDRIEVKREGNNIQINIKFL